MNSYIKVCSQVELIWNINLHLFLERKPLAGFHASPLSWSNWNLQMLVLAEEGKPENLEKKPWSKVRTNKKLNPHMAPGQNRTWATLVAECFHHCTIPPPQKKLLKS